MKKQMLIFFKRVGQAAVEFIAFFPAILMLAAFMFPESIVLKWATFLMVYYITGILLRSVFKGKSRIVSILTGLAVCLLLAYGTFRWGLSMWTSFGAGIVLLFRGILLVESMWDDLFPPSSLWAGILIYFIGYFFYRYSIALMPYAGLITWMGFIYMPVSLVIFNVQQLRRATLAKDAPPVLPAGLVRHNRLLIAITLVVAGIVANFNRLREAVSWLIKALGLLAVKVMLFLSELMSVKDELKAMPEDGGMLGILPEAEPKGPNIFDFLLEGMAYVISIASAIALAAALALVLYKAIKALIGLLARWIREGEWMEVDAGYVDVNEKVADLKTLSREYAGRWKLKLASMMEREPRWEDLNDAAQKVKYLYRRFLIGCIRLGYRPSPSMTPNEIKEEVKAWNENKGRLANMLIPLYNIAKYGRDAENLIDPAKLDELADIIDER